MARKTERITLYEQQPDGQGGVVNTERASFEVEQAGGEDVLDVFQILCRTLIPALKSLAPMLAELLQDELGARKVAGANAGAGTPRGDFARQVLRKVLDSTSTMVVIENLLDVASEFMTRASRQDFKDTMNLLLLRGTVHITRRQGAERFRDAMDREIYNDFFAGDVPGQLKLLAVALRVNYGNFFGARGGASPAPAAGAVPPTSATSSTSHGPSTAPS